MFSGDDKFDLRLDRKFVLSAFFWHEVQEEFHERKIRRCFKSCDSTAMDEALTTINDLRVGEIYSHKEANCSPLCKEKGNFFALKFFLTMQIV